MYGTHFGLYLGHAQARQYKTYTQEDKIKMSECKKVIQSHYRPEVPRGFQEVKVSRLSDNGPRWW